jgi:3-oxoacyl-[acyl-carrier protein] reductase
VGPVDILVNNAGSLIERQSINQMTEDRWDEVMNLNLKSAMLCSRAVAPSMIERKSGAIINVASIAGRTGGGPGAGAYSVAKAGLITFTKITCKRTCSAWRTSHRKTARVRNGDRVPRFGRY